MEPRIGLIVTGQEALIELNIFIKSLEVWHPDATLFIFTDSKTEIASLKHNLKVNTKVCLDKYTGLKRYQMEQTQGLIYNTLWADFMYEKANVLEWMFSTDSKPAWFMDVDITHLAPLPTVPPDAEIALSRHLIQQRQEERFGKYNGGYMWFKNASLLPIWKAHGHKSIFFEQKALETLVQTENPKLFEFTPQVNFGWWRMQQGESSQAQVQSNFSLFRTDKSVGIRYLGEPVQSIHTHWFSKDPECLAFRNWFDNFTSKFKTHKPLNNFRKMVGL